MAQSKERIIEEIRAAVDFAAANPDASKHAFYQSGHGGVLHLATGDDVERFKEVAMRLKPVFERKRNPAMGDLIRALKGGLDGSR